MCLILKKLRRILVAVNTPKFRWSKTRKYQIKSVTDSFRNSTFVEKFLKFIDSNEQNDAESIPNYILHTLAEYETNLDNYRGQSYDNARN